MTFISFAQNFEDVLLWRALKHVEKGFYIDVGAAHPVDGSVTKAFYDRGWCGVNIEPEPEYASALRASRQRDINLEVAVGDHSGKAIFHRIAGTGLSTFYEKTALEHLAAGYPKSEAIETEVTTIDDIWQRYNLETVHFLKIDAEGAERAVILGANLNVRRPWIIVVEATRPFSTERNSDNFRELLIESRYKLRWFDGLNEWYIADEHDDALRESFLLPPNYFDNFVMGNYLAEASRADAAEARIEKLLERLRDVEDLRAGAEEQVAALQQRLSAIHSSTSWKVTAPLRRLRSKDNEAN